MPSDPAASSSAPRSLAGRRALVTGGGRGIGRAIAAALTSQGADVIVLGRSRAPLDEAVSTGAAQRAIACDVTDTVALERAFADAGAIDILVNNAGHAESAPIRRTDRALFDRMIALNLAAVFDGIRLALPGMVARGTGRIVSVASTAGLTGYPYVSAYCAAKHGVVGLTRALAKEVATSGVTVNCICPGFTETDLVAGSVDTIVAKTGRTPEAALAGLTASMPIGRLIRPEEVAAAVLWLVSDAAASVTGIALPVAGGEI